MDNDRCNSRKRQLVLKKRKVLYGMKKYNDFCKALDNLKECEKLSEPYSLVERAGIAALFSVCFEQSWKLIKERLGRCGSMPSADSPGMIIRAASGCCIIGNRDLWNEILELKNAFVHIQDYDSDAAKSAAQKIIREYISAFEELKRNIDKID